MTENTNITDNSGVQTNVGMEFQKHCTLYLLLDSYNEIKDKKYFIILEHLEDIIFGYIDENELLSEIETFQAKKATNKWTLNKVLEIIKKITTASQRIIDDSIIKSADFFQTNYFLTNNTIELKSNQNQNIINETNSDVKYVDLHTEIKNKILKGNSDVSFSEKDKLNIENLALKFIDLTRTSNNQKEQLYGKCRVVFDNLIKDHKAAVDTLLIYFQSIESRFNQGGIALLNDKSKRIESDDIIKIFEILTTRKLAYDFWREKEDEICRALNISLFDKTQFKLHYLNSFDNFKDLKESEHKKIYDFIESNKSIFLNHTVEIDCILEFYNEFNKRKSTTFRELQLKAIISAGFFEIYNKL